MRRVRLVSVVRRRRLLNRAAVMVLMAGLALAGFGGAGLAAGSGGASAGTTTGMATGSCTKAHPCSNPGCSGGGHGAGDCKDATTTSTMPTTTTRPSKCTRAHPCPNPGCTEAGNGSGDCYDVTTTTTATTTTSPPTTTTTAPPPTTTHSSPPPTTNGTTTAPGVLPPPPTTTSSAGSTVPPPPPTTTVPPTTTRPSGTPGAPFLPPRLRKRHHTPTSSNATPAVRTLPFTGANLTLVLELAAGLLGAGLVLVVTGRIPARRSFAGIPAPAGDEPSASPGRTLPDYRVIVPGVGAFATVAEADSFAEERARKRESTGRAENGKGYRVVRTEFGTLASARDVEEDSGE